MKIDKIASKYGLDIISTTTASNGYPQNVKDAMVGFETFEQAQKLAEKYNLSIQSFTKKDGWGFWVRNNNVIFAPYENSCEDYGDNFNELAKMSEADFIEDEVTPFLEGYNLNFERIEELIKNKKEIWEEVSSLEEGEIVITHEGRYYETIKKKSMYFSHDTRNYIIGLI